MDSLIIPLNGWAARERKFHFQVDTEFFQTFDNTEILDALVDVEARVVKESVRKIKVYLALDGQVTVACDRCLEPLELPVEALHELEAEEEGLLSEDGNLDLNQAVYDYICLSLPIQRMHPEGECNPDTVRFLCQEERKDEEAAQSSPFDALKGLFDESKH